MMYRKLLMKAVLGLSASLMPMMSLSAMGWGDGCCDPCDECCCDRFWFDADYLYWKMKDSPEPVPLVVEGPAVPFGTPVLDQPGYDVILGGKKIKNNWRSGGRFALGYWFDDCQCLGGEVSYFFIPKGWRKQSVFSSGEQGSPFFAVPFYDAFENHESSDSIARPGVFSGLASLKLSNFMQGAEVNLVTSSWCDCSMKYGFLAGFRYWNFDENLTFDTDSPFVSPQPADVWQTRDKFDTQNNFFGGQLGASFDFNSCNFFFNVKGKVALGAMFGETRVNGHLITNDFSDFVDVETFEGGYFAQPSNIGRHKKSKFSVIPEIDVNLGYQVSECFRIQVGYTFIYVSNVLYAGNQIDRSINPTQSVVLENSRDVALNGAASPSARNKTASLWIQGVNAGIEFKF